MSVGNAVTSNASTDANTDANTSTNTSANTTVWKSNDANTYISEKQELLPNHIDLKLLRILDVQELLTVWEYEQCKELFLAKEITGYSLSLIHNRQDLLDYELDLKQIGLKVGKINEFLE